MSTIAQKSTNECRVGLCQSSPPREFWNGNVAVCRDRHPHLDDVLQVVPKQRKVFVEASKTGLPTFKYSVSLKEGRYFHSTYDPLSEGVKWAQSAPDDSDSVTVVLGEGFFYHIRELVRNRQSIQPLIIIERDSEIFQEALRALDLKDILSNEMVHIFVGSDHKEAIQFISKIQFHNKRKRLSLLHHKPSIQTFPEFYRAIDKAFKSANTVNIYERMKYKKFVNDEVKVLLFTSQYFLMGEIVSALQRRGLPYRMLNFAQEEVACGEFMEGIIKNIIDFKPDFLFTINHLGMDREGALSDFLLKIEMPYASWYVDNPALIVKYYVKNINPFCTLFIWDKNGVDDMKAFGFEHVFYLPLGVDEKRFCPVKSEINPLKHLASDVGFIGNSMVHKVQKRLEKSRVNGSLLSNFAIISEDYAGSPDRHVDEFIRGRYPALYEEYSKTEDDKRACFDTAVNWEATRTYRLERVRKLLPLVPVIAGDSGWLGVLDGHQFRYQSELNYYRDLPYFYNMIRVNFNATSRQMKEAVNQRVFDVPACKGCLVTDHQDQIHDLFRVGEEVMCYQSPDEIYDLVSYLLGHETERMRIAEKGYNRAIKDHTYVHRIDQMVRTIKDVYMS